jgi:hypothetical protein
MTDPPSWERGVGPEALLWDRHYPAGHRDPNDDYGVMPAAVQSALYEPAQSCEAGT